MDARRRRSIGFGLAIGLIVAVIAAFALRDRSRADSVDFGAAEVNDLPADPVVRLDGTTTALSEFAGAPLVINFWQKNCAPCVKEMPDFESVHQRLGTKVHIIGVNGGDDLETAAAFVRKVGVTYDIVRDPRFDTATAMGVKVYPATFFVRTDGTIASVHYGEYETADDIAAAIATNLGVS